MTATGNAVLDAESDADVRAVVLTGTGDRAFCAGEDLRAFAAGEALESGPGMDAFLRLTDGEVSVPMVGAAKRRPSPGDWSCSSGATSSWRRRTLGLACPKSNAGCSSRAGARP